MSKASSITGGALERGIGEHEPISHRLPRHNSGGGGGGVLEAGAGRLR